MFRDTVKVQKCIKYINKCKLNKLITTNLVLANEITIVRISFLIVRK